MKNSTSIEIVSSENLKEIVREVITEEIPKLLPQKSTEVKYYTRKEAANEHALPCQHWISISRKERSKPIDWGEGSFFQKKTSRKP
jgi:hypothetical protein